MTRAGIGYRTVHRTALLAGEATPEVLEIMPDHFFAQPEAIVPVAELCPVVLHDVGSSVGTVGPEDAERMARIERLVELAKPALFTDHLCLSRGPEGTDLGHLGPLWYTEGLLRHVIERIERWQDRFGVPVALENITAPFVIPHADFTEAEFLGEVVAATGCKVLLDLTNLWINGQNGGFDPATRLGEYPLEAVVQVHLAGGIARDDWWIDSHTAPVQAGSFALLAALRGRAPVEHIIIERDDEIPPLAALLAEADRAGRIWRGEEIGDGTVQPVAKGAERGG